MHIAVPIHVFFRNIHVTEAVITFESAKQLSDGAYVYKRLHAFGYQFYKQGTEPSTYDTRRCSYVCDPDDTDDPVGPNCDQECYCCHEYVEYPDAGELPHALIG